MARNAEDAGIISHDLYWIRATRSASRAAYPARVQVYCIFASCPHDLGQNLPSPLLHTCVSALAWSTSILASATRPLMAQPTCSSISITFSMLLGSSSGEVSRFSTASTTPSVVAMPMAVDPSLIASIAYSTCAEGGWSRVKARPNLRGHEPSPPDLAELHHQSAASNVCVPPRWTTDAGSRARPGHLEEATLRAERVDTAVILGAREEHGAVVRAQI